MAEVTPTDVYNYAQPECAEGYPCPHWHTFGIIVYIPSEGISLSVL